MGDQEPRGHRSPSRLGWLTPSHSTGRHRAQSGSQGAPSTRTGEASGFRSRACHAVPSGDPVFPGSGSLVRPAF